MSMMGALIVINREAEQLPTTLPSISELPLVQLSNIHYNGVFRLPQYPERYDANAKGLAWNSATGSLYVTGNDASHYVGEVSVPAVSDPSPASIAGLSIATTITALADPTEFQWLNVDNPGSAVVFGGLLRRDDGQLIVACYRYYDTGSPAASLSHIVCNPNFTYASGPWQVGLSGHGGITGGYMGVIPAAWRSRLGGTHFTGLVAENIITRTSQGAALHAFNPDDLGVTNPVPVITLLNYPDDARAYGGLGYTICGNDGLVHTDWNQTFMPGGVVFPQGFRSVLFFISIGIGPSHYGLGTGDISLDGIEVYTVTHDPGDIGVFYVYDPVQVGAKGGHNYPYMDKILAYDALDLERVKNGTLNPWAVSPYATWDFVPPFNSYLPRITGVAYEPNGRIFVSQAVADGDTPLIHVLTVS